MTSHVGMLLSEEKMTNVQKQIIIIIIIIFIITIIIIIIIIIIMWQNRLQQENTYAGLSLQG